MLGFGPHNDYPICDFYEPGEVYNTLAFTQNTLVEHITYPLLSQSIEFSQAAVAQVLSFLIEHSLTLSQSAVVNTPVHTAITQSLSFSQATFPIYTKLSHDVGQTLVFGQTARSNLWAAVITDVVVFNQAAPHNQVTGSAAHRLNFLHTNKIQYPHPEEVAHVLNLTQDILWSPRFETVEQTLTISEFMAKLSTMNIETCGCVHFDQILKRLQEFSLEDEITFIDYSSNDQPDHRLIFIQTVETNAVDGVCCRGSDYIPEKSSDGDLLEFNQVVGLEKTLNLTIAQALTFQNTVVYYD